MVGSGAQKWAMFVADCPRCGYSHTTFDITSSVLIDTKDYRNRFECTLLCRSCDHPSIALIQARNGNLKNSPIEFSGNYTGDLFDFIEWIFNIPRARQAPAFVPPNIDRIFSEGAKCLALGLWDAAGAMFRKVLDASTRTLAPPPDSGAEPAAPNWKTWKDLRLRLNWLFENNKLDKSLEDLSACIHQDGNDAVHDLSGIGEAEAEDLADFSEQVLEVIFTLPGRIEENKKRRDIRRGHTS